MASLDEAFNTIVKPEKGKEKEFLSNTIDITYKTTIIKEEPIIISEHIKTNDDLEKYKTNPPEYEPFDYDTEEFIPDFVIADYVFFGYFVLLDLKFNKLEYCDLWKIIEKDFNHNPRSKLSLAYHDTILKTSEHGQHDHCTA